MQDFTSPIEGPLLIGSVIKVQQYMVLIEAFLAQGGFAHVYVVKLQDSSLAVLKRIACADDFTLRELVYEAETHRKVSGHKNIVGFIEYSYSKLYDGGYELLLLMEYCPGGHLVDYLNTRLNNRPSGHEIMRIFSDICEAVAHLHGFNPPIIHRDIKIENVLLKDGQFKLCDFGSCTTKAYAANTMALESIKSVEEEIAKHTTLQYRSPEMCDLYMRRELSHKSDIWALGVLLYKLCFFTTPFEDGGKLAILSSRYTIPTYPCYSPEILDLVTKLLEPDVQKRPDIYQTFSIVCKIRGIDYNLPIEAKPIMNSAIRNSPSNAGPFRQVSEPNFSLDESNFKANNISPMRRGRPDKSTPTYGSSSSLVSPMETTPKNQRHETRIISSFSGKDVEFNSNNDPWSIPANNTSVQNSSFTAANPFPTTNWTTNNDPIPPPKPPRPSKQKYRQ